MPEPSEVMVLVHPDGRPASIEKKKLIDADEVTLPSGVRGQAEAAVQEAVKMNVANVGIVHRTTEEQGIAIQNSWFSYRIDQAVLPRVSYALDSVATQPGSQVVEHYFDGAVGQRGPHSLRTTYPVMGSR